MKRSKNAKGTNSQKCKMNKEKNKVRENARIQNFKGPFIVLATIDESISSTQVPRASTRLQQQGKEKGYPCLTFP